jgi:hypothetical protein
VAALPATVADTAKLLADQAYIADQELATTVHLSLAMRRPLFLEGEPVTGKTEIAKVLAAGLGRRLVRLQCYDGMDLSAAAYEWDHARQLMAIRLAEAAGQTDPGELAGDIYTRKYLLARPLLSAIDPDLPPAVLLIDELDRADEPFEAFLLELLADFRVTVPEFGTGRARALPAVVITSPRTRAVRRDPPALPVSLGGLPECSARTGDPGGQGAGCARAPVRPGGGIRAAAAQRGPLQAAGRRRDDRLGAGADLPEPEGAGAAGGGRDLGRSAEISGRYRQDPRR